jgi:hypothetical protein
MLHKTATDLTKNYAQCVSLPIEHMSLNASFLFFVINVSTASDDDLVTSGERRQRRSRELGQLPLWTRRRRDRLHVFTSVIVLSARWAASAHIWRVASALRLSRLRRA